jgi:hypothetical protein
MNPNEVVCAIGARVLLTVASVVAISNMNIRHPFGIGDDM